MRGMMTVLISSLLILAQDGTAYEIAEEMESDFASEEWLKMAEVSWMDDEDDIENHSDESGEWDDELSMRSGPPSNQKHITLDVYYESMCPYSRRYITNQVEPASAQLKDYVHVNLIPYGNAMMKTTRDGEMEVHCQHGVSECIGNKIHACGMERLKTNQEKISYVSCVMKTPDPKIGGQNCSEPYGLNWEQIESCSESHEGDDLHSRFGETTRSLNPPNKGVPTTAINKSRGSDGDQRQMKGDLFGVLCQKLWEMSVRPKECGFRMRNRQTWETIRL